MPGLIWTYINFARYTWYYSLLTSLICYITGMTVLTLYFIVLVGLILYLDNNATVCDTFYYPDQQKHDIYSIYTQCFIYRQYSYVFQCTRVIFRESYPSTLLKLQKLLRLQTQ